MATAIPARLFRIPAEVLLTTEFEACISGSISIAFATAIAVIALLRMKEHRREAARNRWRWRDTVDAGPAPHAAKDSTSVKKVAESLRVNV